MSRCLQSLPGLLALLLVASAVPAFAHHPMGYALPATAMDGFLSGIGHPVIGVDHLLFIAGAGVLAARFERGWFLPLVFVVASVLATGARYLGNDLALGELPVAVSLIVLGAMILAARTPRDVIVALVFLAAGVLHGHALAEAIVGAERTPLVAYLTGLCIIQCVIAFGAWRAAIWMARRYPRIPLRQLAGAAAGIAGLVFSGMALTLPIGNKKLPGIGAEDIGRCAYSIFRKGLEYIGQTVGIAGEHLTGAQMAAALSRALEKEIRYDPETPDQYREHDFPAAKDIGNMFQYSSDFESDYCGARSVETTRSLNPDLQSFDRWLSKYKDRIPLD